MGLWLGGPHAGAQKSWEDDRVLLAGAQRQLGLQGLRMHMGSGTWENKKEPVNTPSPQIIELRLKDIVESLEAVTPGWLGPLKDIKWVVVVNQGRGLSQWVEPEEPGWGLEAKGFGSWMSGGGAGLESWGVAGEPGTCLL